MKPTTLALSAVGLALLPSLCCAQTAPAIGAASETITWGNAQIDAGGRYSVLWRSRLVKSLGRAPNIRHVVSVEATDSVNPNKGIIFRGTLMIACGSRVAYWAGIEVMNFDYIEDSLLSSRNATEFTPSTAIGPSAFEKVCGEDARKVREFEQALQQVVKVRPDNSKN
jgi:hypothetical protein